MMTYKVFSTSKSSFILDRAIDENILVIKEVAHIFKKAKASAYVMALKINLSKAFDSLERGFIEDYLIRFNFPSQIIDLIMHIISTPFISILRDETITPPFLPSRGIRRGDPLFPCIFIPCMEHLYFMIEQQDGSKIWKPSKICEDIHLSHLFYANDVFLFGRASHDNLDSILKVLKDFG